MLRGEDVVCRLMCASELQEVVVVREEGGCETISTFLSSCPSEGMEIARTLVNCLTPNDQARVAPADARTCSVKFQRLATLERTLEVLSQGRAHTQTLQTSRIHFTLKQALIHINKSRAVGERSSKA